MKRVFLVLFLSAAIASAAPQIVNSFAAPATGVVGLAYGSDYLWALTSTRYIYKLDPATGAVQSSFLVSPAVANPDGLGFGGSLLYVTAGVATVYKYNMSGSLAGTTILYVSGWSGNTYYPVGGAGSSSTAMYFIGTSNQIYTASPLPLPSTLQPTQTGTISTGIGTYDCAREGTNNSVGDLWVATNQTTNCIRAYNAAGTQVNAIDLIPAARGMAYSTSGGHRYLWASNPNDNTIYQIDLDYGLGVEEGTEGTPVGLSVGENPFDGMTTLVGSGFAPGATLEIFDITGRKVVEAPFQDTFSWSGASAAPGVYLVVVSDETGAMASLSVTRL